MGDLDRISAFRTDLGWVGIVWWSIALHPKPGVLAAPESPHAGESLDWHAYRTTFGHSSRKAMLDHLRDLEEGQTRTSPKTAMATLASSQLSRSQSKTVDIICGYAAGEPVSLSEVPVVISDRTPFQQSVLNACRRVPRGETRTYAEIAECVGHPRAARAVGNAMATNRTPLLIPCHRIVPSGGGRRGQRARRSKGRRKLGGFTAPGGVTMKQRLLDLESETQSWMACR